MKDKKQTSPEERERIRKANYGSAKTWIQRDGRTWKGDEGLVRLVMAWRKSPAENAEELSKRLGERGVSCDPCRTIDSGPR